MLICVLELVVDGQFCQLNLTFKGVWHDNHAFLSNAIAADQPRPPLHKPLKSVSPCQKFHRGQRATCNACIFTEAVHMQALNKLHRFQKC